MNCSRCGAPAIDRARFCPACGAAISAPVPDGRPGVVTVLAIVMGAGAALDVLIALACLAAAGREASRVPLVFAVIFFMFAAAAMVCSYGLWNVRVFGRYLLIAFSILGLLAFPFGTIVSILILISMFRPGVAVLFSGKPFESLTEPERAQLAALQTAGAGAIVVAIVVAVPVAIFGVGIMAAIAIPNFLNAVDRGKQFRTMADMRSIQHAMESYAGEHNVYPAASTALDLRPLLEPAYIKTMPMQDGWEHAFRIDSSSTDYTIYSQGKDGSGADCDPGETVTFNDEICLVNGQFVRYPQGRQR
jgi:general secretion pathway protein G